VEDERGPLVVERPSRLGRGEDALQDTSKLRATWDHFHRLGWCEALESLADIVVNEFGEVVNRDEVLRVIRLLMDE
jgi:hypothetical protein